MEKLKQFFVKKIYADHNSSKSVQKALRKLIDELPDDGKGLNVGAGKTSLDKKIKNMEIEEGENIHYVGSVEDIPLPNSCLDLVITQEVLEHVRRPEVAMQEISRVLKKNGKLYLQLPFIIGYHPCPKDYWRFTHEGICELAYNNNLKIIEQKITVGSATGFYRILVEFLSILFSLPLNKTYRVFKAIFSLIFYPVKLLDPLLALSPQRDRIAGGYYIICEKNN